jgi:hypothetical protein
LNASTGLASNAVTHTNENNMACTGETTPLRTFFLIFSAILSLSVFARNEHFFRGQFFFAQMLFSPVSLMKLSLCHLNQFFASFKIRETATVGRTALAAGNRISNLRFPNLFLFRNKKLCFKRVGVSITISETIIVNASSRRC